MLSQTFQKRWRFFHRQAGGVVGQAALTAMSLARAEQYAAEMGWECYWHPECERDGPREWGWSEADIKRFERDQHECEYAVLKDRQGRPLASLCCIWDADSIYRRLVAAELACEAMPKERPRVHVRRYCLPELGERMMFSPLNDEARDWLVGFTPSLGDLKSGMCCPQHIGESVLRMAREAGLVMEENA